MALSTLDVTAKSKVDWTGSARERWEFTDDDLRRSPSVLGGYSFTEEQALISYGCTFIRKMADRLNEAQKDVTTKVSQRCISVAIIQLRRFFTIQSLQSFDARDVGAAVLFLCTKTEECPRRLEVVVRAWYKIRHELDVKTMDQNESVAINKETYEKFCDYITWLENIVLQTINFNLVIDLPHPTVLYVAQLWKPGDKKLQEALFWLATDILHLTNWSLRFKSPVISSATFYLALLWMGENPESVVSNGSSWLSKIDSNVTFEQLADEGVYRDLEGIGQEFSLVE